VEVEHHDDFTGRKTIKMRMRARLLAIKIELRSRMHDSIAKTGAWIKRMLQGVLNYFAVSGNHPSLWWFFNEMKRLWLMSLRRRSQKAYLTWETFIRLVDRFFPPIRTLHPLPSHRFDAKTPLGERECVTQHGCNPPRPQPCRSAPGGSGPTLSDALFDDQTFIAMRAPHKQSVMRSHQTNSQ